MVVREFKTEMSPGLLKAIAEDDSETARKLIDSGQNIKAKDSRGNTALHIAVTRNNVDIVSHLLDQKKIMVNARNINEATPFFLAVEKGYIEIVKILLDFGANIHLPTSKKVTPLHASVLYPSITKLLLERGAEIESRDMNGETPLHYAAIQNNLETVCMLLYHNADANAISNNNDTPFTKGLMTSISGDVQTILLEYSDLSGCGRAFLSFAMLFKTSHNFLRLMIEKGAKVTFQSFNTSLQFGDLEYFRIILKNIPDEEIEDLTFYDFLDVVSDEHIEEYFTILLESPKIELFIKNLTHIFYLIGKLSEVLSENLITKLTMLVLTHGYSPTSIDINTIFFHHGYSDLLRKLLYIDYTGNFNSMILTSKLIFDVTSNVDNISQDILSFRRGWLRPDQFKKDIETFFKYCCVPKLVYYYVTQTFVTPDYQLTSRMPKIPSLIELARNKVRKYIVDKKKLYRASQYYTYINSLPISSVYKKILKFETKLYVREM